MGQSSSKVPVYPSPSVTAEPRTSVSPAITPASPQPPVVNEAPPAQQYGRITAAEAVSAVANVREPGGLADLETTLRTLAVAASAALEAVRASAAVARARIDEVAESARALQSTAHEGSDADMAASHRAVLEQRITALHADIAAAEARIVAALESDAVRVDNALAAAESLRAGDSSGVCSPVDCFPMFPDDRSRIDVRETGAPATGDPLPFRICALGTPALADVELLLPSRRSVLPAPGQPLCELRLLPAAASLLHEGDAGAAASWLSRFVSASAALVTRPLPREGAGSDTGAAPVVAVSLPVAAQVLNAKVVLMADLSGAPEGLSFAVLTRVCVAGQPLSATASVALPLPVPVGCCTPLRPFLVLQADDRHRCPVPAISDVGVLYQPVGEGRVAAFGPDGSPLPSIQVAGLPHVTCAAFCRRSGLLLLAESHGGGRVGAVDPATGELRWATAPPGGRLTAEGVAVMPEHGIVVVADSAANSLLLFLVADGSLLSAVKTAAALPAGSPPQTLPDASPTFVAYDASSGLLYTSLGNSVVAWTWDAALCQLVRLKGPAADALTASAGPGGTPRPIAIVPAARGLPGCLVIGLQNAPVLRVLSLRDHRLLGKVSVEGGVCVSGLAGDPTGDTLAVYDQRWQFVRVLKWPLPGLRIAATSAAAPRP